MEEINEEVKNIDWLKGSYDNIIFNMFDIIENITTENKLMNENEYLLLAPLPPFYSILSRAWLGVNGSLNQFQTKAYPFAIA